MVSPALTVREVSVMASGLSAGSGAPANCRNVHSPRPRKLSGSFKVGGLSAFMAASHQRPPERRVTTMLNGASPNARSRRHPPLRHIENSRTYFQN